MFKSREEAKAYFAKLATDHALPEDVQKSLAAALEHEEFAKAVTDGFMLKGDYDRNKGKVAEERKAVEDYRKKLEEWEAAKKTDVARAEQVWAEYQQMVQTYGKPNGGTPQNPPVATNGMSKDEIAKMLEEYNRTLASGVSSFLKNTLTLSNDYHRRFGKPLDVGEFDSFLARAREADPNIDYQQAFQQYIAPEMEKKTAEERKAWEEKIRAEERQAIFSKHHIPVDTGQKQTAPAWDPQRHEIAKLPQEQQEEIAEADFFKAWGEAGAAARTQ